MKKLTMVFLAAMVAISFTTLTHAMEMKVTGEVVKAEGEFVEVKDDKGKVHKMHTDKTTKVTGEVKAGAKVEAEITEKGHATSIAVKDAGAMKK